MRIALLLTSLDVGGAERQVLWLARHLALRGHTVRLFVLLPRGPGSLLGETEPTEFQVTFMGIRKRPWSVLTGLARAASEIRSFRPDVLHSHNFHGNLAGRLLGQVCQVPVVSTIHNVYEGGWQRMLAYRFTDAWSRRTIAVSEAVHERYLQMRVVDARKAGVISNGIEVAELVPDAERHSRLRAEMGATERDFVWIAVGRLTPAKDYPNLLRAFVQAAGAHLGIRLWIVGYGQPAYVDEMRKLAGELGIGKSVSWLGARRDIAALLDAADGFVLASSWEGMPLAVGEAMAMAKPVIATDVGGVSELLGETGWLVPAKNPGALAEAISRMMTLSGEERQKIGQAARARILERFSMEAKVREWEEVYRSVIR